MRSQDFAAAATATVPATAAAPTAARAAQTGWEKKVGEEGSWEKAQGRGLGKAGRDPAMAVAYSELSAGVDAHTTYGAARASVLFAVVAAGCLYFRRSLGACASRVRRLPALLAGVKGRLEAPAAELQQLNPTAGGLNASPEGSDVSLTPAERRRMRCEGSGSAPTTPVASSAIAAVHATAGVAQEGNGWDDDGWDNDDWGDDAETPSPHNKL